MALPTNAARLRVRAERIHRNALARKRAALNDPSRVIERLTPKTLNAAVKKVASGKYAPQEQALKTNIANLQARDDRELPGWFNQYRTAIADAEAKTQAAYDAAQRSSEARTAQTQAAEDQRQAALNEAAKQDASIRGATPSGVPSQLGQQAQIARRVLEDSYGAKIGAQGAAQAAYFEGSKAASSRQEMEQRLAVDRQKDQLGLQLGALRGERGGYAQEYRDKLREAERQWALEQQTLLSKQQQQQLQGQATRSLIRQRAAQIRQNDRRLDLEAQRVGISRGNLRLARNRLGETRDYHDAMQTLRQQGFDLSQRKFLWQKHVDDLKASGKWKGAGGGKGGGGAEKQASFNAKGSIQNTVGLIRSLRAKGEKDSLIRQQLAYPKSTKAGNVQGYGVPYLSIDAAFERLRPGGYLSPTTIRKLRTQGVNVPRGWINPGSERRYYPRPSGDTSTRPG